MSKLTREEVLNLARLARLHLSDDEIENFQNDISSILDYIDELKHVELGNLKPTYQVTGLRNVMRKDEVIDYNQSQDELLKNAPRILDKQIQVKRMLE